jgi:hypothetical protein
MNKKTIITALLALLALMGWAQSTKIATVTGYSPALKDGTLVLAGTGTGGTIVDTVQAGRFAYTLPVEGFTESNLSFLGEGCPNMYMIIFLKPDVTVKVTGTDLFVPLWKVESPLPEQQTQSRITEYCRDIIAEDVQLDLAHASLAERTRCNEMDEATNGHLALTASGCCYDPYTGGHIQMGNEHQGLSAHGTVERSGKNYRCPCTKRI